MMLTAISLHQPWATLIRNGDKTIETRRWATRHRGPLLICSSKLPAVEGHLCGYALCVADVVDCRPMTVDDEHDACTRIYPQAQAWILKNLRVIDPFPVKGHQRFFEVDVPDVRRSLLPFLNRTSNIVNRTSNMEVSHGR